MTEEQKLKKAARERERRYREKKKLEKAEEADLQATVDPAPESAMQSPGRFASPLTGEYAYPGDNNDGVTDAPYDKPKETTVDDIIRDEYGYCINSLTGPQRALLSELIRIRRLMENK